MPDLNSQSSTSDMSRSLLPFLITSLKDFITSSNSFRILYTHPPTRLPPPSALPLYTLYVLDSSFNPPSGAHAWLARDAVLSGVRRREGERGSNWEGIRLLLLLATQNADKPSKPAAFEDRLGMMVLMARYLYSQLLDAETQRTKTTAHKPSDSQGSEAEDSKASLGMFAIDVGVIKQPYFVDKASAIEESGVYGDKARFEQVHLTGFDTLMRIFDKKYYGEQGLKVLEPFLKRGRIRAVIRPGEEWGSVEEQKGWIQSVRKGGREAEGLRTEWAERVELVEAQDGEGEVQGVSSTKVREGVKRGDWGVVEELVGRQVMEWIRERGVYLEEDGKL